MTRKFIVKISEIDESIPSEDMEDLIADAIEQALEGNFSLLFVEDAGEIKQ